MSGLKSILTCLLDSPQFLDNENQGIVARKTFEKKVKGLLKEIEESKSRASDLSSELELLSTSSSKAVNDLQATVDKLRGDLKAANYSTMQAESRLKQVEWLRSEEMKKYGFSGRTVKKKGAKGGRKHAGARVRTEVGGKTKGVVGVQGGGGSGGSKQLMMLKTENERLKRSLYKAQQASGKTSVVKGSASPVPKLYNGPSKVEQVNEAKKEYHAVKEELKSVDGERKAVKEGVKIWLANFEEKHGHAATSGDKEEILGQYKKLREIESRVKELKETEKKLKAKVKDLKESLDKPPEGNEGGVTEDEGPKYDVEGADLAKAGAKAAKVFTSKINSLKQENEELKKQIEDIEAVAASKEIELLSKVQAREKENVKKEKENARLKERLEDAKKNEDATLKHDIEVAEKRANEYRNEMLAAKTATKKMESSFKELKERTEGAESQVKELRGNQVSCSKSGSTKLRRHVLGHFLTDEIVLTAVKTTSLATRFTCCSRSLLLMR